MSSRPPMRVRYLNVTLERVEPLVAAEQLRGIARHLEELQPTRDPEPFNLAIDHDFGSCRAFGLVDHSDRMARLGTLEQTTSPPEPTP